MRFLLAAALVLVSGAFCLAADKPDAEQGFVSLFDGKTFNGWKVGKNADCFKIQDGMIVVNGKVAHLFYDGPVNNHDFKKLLLSLPSYLRISHFPLIPSFNRLFRSLLPLIRRVLTK